MTATIIPIAYLMPVSPLVLADRLLTLAQDADRAGYRDAASSLVSLVYSVLDDAVPAGPFISGRGTVRQPARQASQLRRPVRSPSLAGQPNA